MTDRRSDAGDRRVARDERDLTALVEELSATLDALRDAVGEPDSPEGRRIAGRDRGVAPGPAPPTPRELLRFSEQYTIPTLIALLESGIRSLELLRATLRLLDGRGIEGVRAVIPRGLVPIAGVTYRNQTVARRQATATTPATFQEESIVDGRAFEMGADQVVLNEVAAAAFEENVTVGERLIVRLASGEERNLTVVGIVSGTRGGFLGGFGDATPRFYLPVDPFYTSTVGVPGAGYDQKAYPQVTVVSDTRRVQSVKEAIVAYASEESDARELLPEGVGVTVRTSEDIVEEIQDVIERITRFVTGIAVLSLVVGAIGIANITLVSVAERTREIGIMKAVGARNRDVLQLFLTEAVLLGVLGAGVGVPLGLLVGWGATAYAEVSFAIALDWLVGAVVMGVSVGVVAGLYPAWRASKVDPIDALRYE